MIIGIDASRAFLKRRTGIEEYAYQVIKHLRDTLPPEAEVVLYVRKKLTMHSRRLTTGMPEIDFELPPNWRVRGIWAPRFWTQARLSLEMLFQRPDALFVPAHTVPVIHPGHTVVTVHGLEYEFCPEAYSWWERLYMRTSIRYSVRAAQTVVAVSENTKADLIRLYRVPAEKIRVVYEGYEGNIRPRVSSIKKEDTRPYLLFIGRLEERKNIVRIIEAFESLKERRGIPHRLVLAGKPGYGYSKIHHKIQNSKFRKEIEERGYVSETEKWALLEGAAVFLFPTLYEGFGLPVLEAQAVGVPVVTSCTSSLPEVGGEGAVYVDPLRSEDIARALERVLSVEIDRTELIKKATHNVSRFSWAQCAREIGGLFIAQAAERIERPLLSEPPRESGPRRSS